MSVPIIHVTAVETKNGSRVYGLGQDNKLYMWRAGVWAIATGTV